MNQQNTLRRVSITTQWLNLQDETARLRAQITREYEMLTWAQANLSEESSKQLYITRRKSAIGEYRKQLVRLIGERQAASIIQQILAQTPHTNQQNTYTRPLE